MEDGFVWNPWHAWVDGYTAWIDGRVEHEDGTVVGQLDIGCAHDGGDGSRIPDAQALAALVMWESGEVLLLDSAQQPAHTLVVPHRALDTALLVEALARADAARVVETLRRSRSGAPDGSR